MDFTTSLWSHLRHAASRQAGRLAAKCALGSALAASVLIPATAAAQTRLKPKIGAADASQVSVVNTPTVRLSFFNENWADVLKKVAAETNSTLVMDETPRGRVNRIDRKLYSRAEAVRVLNRDLEPMGFRLMEKGDNLVLFTLRDLRTDYRRTSLQGASDGTAHGVARPGGRPIVPARRAPQVAPTDEENSEYEENEPPRRTVVPASATAPAARPRVEPAHYASDTEGTVEFPLPAARNTLPRGTDALRAHLKGQLQTSSVTPKARAVDLRPVELRVPLQTRKAVEVARTIFEGSKAHAELVDDGPEGLPAFTVRSPHETAGGADPHSAALKYTVGIDSESNELIVNAPSTRARQIEKLIRMLDARPVKRGDAERLVPTAGDNPKLAGRLQATINQLAQANAEPGDEPPPRTQNPASGNQRKPVEDLLKDGDAPGNAGANAGPKNANPQILSPPVNLTLQGPVTVRDVPGVGLVVTGNRADVDAVLDVIRVLELAGNTATPDIHLLGLRHVNSEALAELMTLVYDALSEVRAPLIGEQRKSIRVVPVVKPNAVLIIAPSREMESVLELAEALDQPVDPEAEVEVFPLKFAVASQIVTSIDTFYTDRKPMGTRVKTFADVRTNSIVVYARPNDLKEVARLIQKLDVGTSASVARMRIFPLENATAPELAALINSALQSVLRPPQVPTTAGGQFGAQQGGGAGQTPTALSDVKSTILEFLSTDGDRDKLIRSGILSDIRVTADVGRNTLIVSAPEASMPLIEALIQAFDQPTPLVAQIKVFTLSNSSAITTIDLLQQLFTGQTQRQGQGGGQFGGGQFGANQAQGGMQLAGAEGAGAGLIPLRFSVDGRTNSIIAIGPAGALEIVEAVLLKLDASDVRERKKTVIKLRNTFANDIATAVNQFLTAQRDLAQLDPNLVSTVELLEREVIVVPELVSNSLIISATPRYYQDAVDLIEKLDRRPQEVTIQALLVEVTLTNNDEYGVELGVQDSILFNRSVANVPGFLFNNQQLGNNTAAQNPGRVGGQGLSNFSLNRTNPDLGFGGLVLSASSESVSVLIRALSSKRTVHVLSRPQIRTLDNQIAQILVGQQVPVATGVATTGLTAASPQVQLKDVGIVLNVIPRISPDGTIVMEVAATSSSVSAIRVPIFTDITTGNTVDSPIINTTSAQSTISVPNGQTVVLGGMITKSDDAFERKVPWIGDIPLIGNLFRYEGVNVRRTELLVFLTPRVVRHEADSELIKRVEAERLHFVERDAEEVHGPLYSAPPPEWYLNRPQPGEGYPAGPGLFDENNVPTTVMPGYPDASVSPVPNGRLNSTQEALPPLPQRNQNPIGVPDPPPNRIPQRSDPNGAPSDLPPSGANSSRTWLRR